MLLLFAGGVMNRAVIGALTAFVAFENSRRSVHTARRSAVFLRWLPVCKWLCAGHSSFFSFFEVARARGGCRAFVPHYDVAT